MWLPTYKPATDYLQLNAINFKMPSLHARTHSLCWGSSWYETRKTSVVSKHTEHINANTHSVLVAPSLRGWKSVREVHKAEIMSNRELSSVNCWVYTATVSKQMCESHTTCGSHRKCLRKFSLWCPKVTIPSKIVTSKSAPSNLDKKPIKTDWHLLKRNWINRWQERILRTVTMTSSSRF